MKILKKTAALLLALIIAMCPLMMQAGAAEENSKMLKFNNGKFKILILSDIQDTDKPQKDTMDLLKSAIEKTKPDFIALTGDNIDGTFKNIDKERATVAVDKIAGAIDSYGIPFAFVYGNHDAEGLSANLGITEEEAKEFLMSVYQKYDNCLAVEGEEMTGVGNYNLLVKDSAGEKDIFNLWFMDSNAYTPDSEGGGYGYVHEDQTAWYQKTSNALKEANGGEPMPSLLFQHIAVPEVYDMLTEVPKGTDGAISRDGKYYAANPEMVYQGDFNEPPCPPNSNHGQFDSWVEQGDIVGAFFGHDHTNTFEGKYKGIKMVAVPGVTYYSYGDNHGVRTITLDENNLTDFETEVLSFMDVTGHKESSAYNAKYGHAAFIYSFLPIFLGITAGVVVLAAGVITGVVIYKKKKKNK